MKITLQNPPKGYEAEAYYDYPSNGDKFLTIRNEIVTKITNLQSPTKYIILTPQKPKVIPFTHTTFKKYRNRWFIRSTALNEPLRATSYDPYGVWFLIEKVAYHYKWENFLAHFVFETNHKPAGIEQ